MMVSQYIKETMKFQKDSKDYSKWNILTNHQVHVIIQILHKIFQDKKEGTLLK